MNLLVNLNPLPLPIQGDKLDTIGFHMNTYESCKQIWKNCIEYHAFFRLSGTKGTPTAPPRSDRKRARGGFVGRTEQQAIEANRAAALARSNSVRVVRYVGGYC